MVLILIILYSLDYVSVLPDPECTRADVVGSAMYLTSPQDGSVPQAVPSPSTSAGLYIYPRTAPGQPRPEAVKVAIPADCLGPLIGSRVKSADETAFQTGEALELLTGGKLAATPHFVSGNSGPTKSGEAVSRETFAFFLQYVPCL